MAGPACKFAPGSQNISTQSLAINHITEGTMIQVDNLLEHGV
jgi:hypothetical protein